MNINYFKSLRCWVALLTCCLLLTAAPAQDAVAQTQDSATQAQDATAHTQDAATSPADDSTALSADAGKTTTFDSASDDNDDDADVSKHHHHHHHRSDDNNVVSIGRRAELRAGEHADGVVAIFGSATSAGDVDDAVVSVLGSTRVTGGKVNNSAVAVMGSAYINAEVDGDVVAVMGNVELGPEAKVHGDVVVVGGELKRDPNAVVDGHVQNVFGIEWADFGWLRPWMERCLLYGRPLAFGSGLGWAWGIALGLLALYVFIAFLFRSAVDKCIHTLETEPGNSILAALLLTLGTPILFVLLFITVLGIAAVPFLAIAVLCAAMFGKIVVLAAIGKRCTPSLANDPATHTVVGVIVGGLIVMMIYTVPVVGFIVYKLLELLGLGVVVYTLLLSVRASRAARTGGKPPPGAAAQGFNSTGTDNTGASNMGTDSMGASASGASAPGTNAPGGGPPPYTPSGPAGAGPTSQPPLNVSALPRAGFGIRMGALLLDIILIGIITHQLPGHGDVHVILLAAYGAVMWKLKGSTIGGIICGLQVVRVDGRPIDWPTAIVRALGCFLSLAVVGLGFIWIAIDPDHQGWHDKIAGTAVVRAPKGASLL